MTQVINKSLEIQDHIFISNHSYLNPVVKKTKGRKALFHAKHEEYTLLTYTRYKGKSTTLSCPKILKISKYFLRYFRICNILFQWSFLILIIPLFEISEIYFKNCSLNMYVYAYLFLLNYLMPFSASLTFFCICKYAHKYLNHWCLIVINLIILNIKKGNYFYSFYKSAFNII